MLGPNDPGRAHLTLWATSMIALRLRIADSSDKSDCGLRIEGWTPALTNMGTRAEQTQSPEEDEAVAPLARKRLAASLRTGIVRNKAKLGMDGVYGEEGTPRVDRFGRLAAGV